jgi:hypothetical protein
MNGVSAQGRQANKSGQAAEAAICSMFRERHYLIEKQRYIGVSIYGLPLKCDLFVSGIVRFPTGLIVESKWQEKGGSVDEKFPYLVENIKRKYPCPAIVVAGGGGAKPEAIDWLRRQADGYKLFAVFSLEEILTWTIRNL